MSKSYGYNYKQTNKNIGINEYEYVRVLFLERDFPTSYKEEISKAILEEQEQSMLLGKKVEGKKMSYKEGGIIWKYAIIKRSNNPNSSKVNHNVISFDNNGNLIEPDYTYRGVIYQAPPKKIFEKRINAVRGGDIDGALHRELDYPIIKNFLPPVFPPYDTINNRPFNKINENEMDSNVIDLRNKENKRQELWKQIIDDFEKLSEDEALDLLENTISYRFLLGYVSNNSYVYVKPQKGLMFDIIRGPITSKYIDLLPFRYDKIENKYIYYTKNIIMPTDKSIELADVLINHEEPPFIEEPNNDDDPDF